MLSVRGSDITRSASFCNYHEQVLPIRCSATSKRLTDDTSSLLARHGINIRDGAAIPSSVRRPLPERRVVCDATSATLEVILDVDALIGLEVAASRIRVTVYGTATLGPRASRGSRATATDRSRRLGRAYASRACCFRSIHQ